MYPRLAESDILEHIDSPEAVFILGSRQVGKTSLMKRIMELVGIENSLYLDLENPQNQIILNAGIASFEKFLRFQRKARTGKIYVFIDEIQYASDFSSLIKYFVDNHADAYKLILSGSSSLSIKQGFKESLVGRKRIIELYNLSFSEFCRFKGNSEFADSIEGYLYREGDYPLPMQFAKAEMLELGAEYLLYGGYPKLVLSRSIKEKKAVLADIVQSYLIKDIRQLFQIDKLNEFNHLVYFLAASTGTSLNISQLSNEVKLDSRTLNSYIQVLADSYMLTLLRPYHTGKTSELRKAHKLYWLDNGIRNFLIEDFRSLEKRTDRGYLLESAIVQSFIRNRNPLDRIYYWRTKNGNELDFIIRKDDQYTGYEAKWKLSAGVFANNFNAVYPEIACKQVVFDYDQTDIGIDIPFFIF